MRLAMLRILPLLLVALGAGCRVRHVEFKTGVDAAATGRAEARAVDDGAIEPDGAADLVVQDDSGVDSAPACVPHPEECNLKDDDCNGLVDDGFDLTSNIQNCGRCGNACAFANGQGVCAAGKCRLDTCQTGFVNLDGLGVNGCECQTTNDGVELCDGKDNNCNGQVDEGFLLDTSIDNCGRCGRACRYTNAVAACVKGTCHMADCGNGFFDLDGSPRNGCEYACSKTNGGVEICDGKDNNCDGVIDESDARAGTACYPDATPGCDVITGQCRGLCGFGRWACLPGGLVCQNATLPRPDLCDGKDNDCDGTPDQDFDLQNDPRWCGACNKVCDLPHTVNGCTAGVCSVKSCRAGWVDLDKVATNGCEYECTPDGPEVCDGKDNDCDGRKDGDDDDILAPMVNFCSQVGECGNGPGGSTRYPGAKTFPICVTPPGAARPDWICNYPDTVQQFAPNQVLGQETWCDGKDNDCDGAVDEHTVPPVGSRCTDMGIGECRKVGKLVCQPDKTLAPSCDISGVPNYVPVDETCDGKDNDCDGAVDESWDTPGALSLPTCSAGACRGVRDDLVHVTAGFRDYYIYAYEATRVDATKDAQGTQETRACSRNPATGALPPWTSVTYAKARDACGYAGMRLCRTTRLTSCSSSAVQGDEWGFACAAGLTCPPDNASRRYPYGCDYTAATCNGVDKGLTDPAPAGSTVACVTGDLDTATGGTQGAYDMSGNVAEWTEDCRGVLNDGSGRRAFTLRGGSHNNIAQGLRCDFMSLVVAENFAFTDTGFRCCSSCAPGLADCGAGVCANLGTDANNCGTCGIICGAGTTCANGTCK